MSWNLQQINGTQPTVPNAEQIRCTGAPPVGSNQPVFVCTFGSQQHFVYVDSGRALVDCYSNVQASASHWNWAPITGAGGLFPKVSQPAKPPFVCAFGDELHFTYIDGNEHVQDFCYSGGDFTDIANWKQQQINAGVVSNAPKAVSALFVCVFQSQLHFAYLDTNDNIQDCFYDGAGSQADPNHWHLQQINNGKLVTVSAEYVACPDAPAVGGGLDLTPALFVATFENQQHFTYTDADSNLQDCVYDGNSNTWQVYARTGGSWPFSSPAPSGYPSGTSVSVCVFGTQLHFVYVDANLRLQDWFFDSAKQYAPEWALWQIVNTGAPTMPGDTVVCPDAIVPMLNTSWWCAFAYNGLLQSKELHYVYLDLNGNIQDVFLEETSDFQQWTLRQINGTVAMVDAESIACSSAPKGGPPFLSAFGDELHYTYVDDNNAVQDIVWTPILRAIPIPVGYI